MRNAEGYRLALLAKSLVEEEEYEKESRENTFRDHPSPGRFHELGIGHVGCKCPKICDKNRNEARSEKYNRKNKQNTYTRFDHKDHKCRQNDKMDSESVIVKHLEMLECDNYRAQSDRYANVPQNVLAERHTEDPPISDIICQKINKIIRHPRNHD